MNTDNHSEQNNQSSQLTSKSKLIFHKYPVATSQTRSGTRKFHSSPYRLDAVSFNRVASELSTSFLLDWEDEVVVRGKPLIKRGSGADTGVRESANISYNMITFASTWWMSRTLSTTLTAILLE